MTVSWQQLLGLVADSVTEARALDAAERRACPRDAEPLERDAEGVLRCGFCGWPKHTAVTGEA